MTSKHAQLIFLGGPDGGRRILLDRLPVKIGRSSECSIRVNEPHASREQAVFTTSPEGVVLENLSRRGTEIGGKTYKRGKGVLLATGDVITLGVETEILFVGAGDDSAEALSSVQARRQAQLDARQQAELQRQREQQERADRRQRKHEPEPEASAEFVPAPAPAAVAEQPAKPAKVADLGEVDRKKRTRRIAVALGIYLGLIVVVGVVLSLRGEKKTEEPRPRQLSRQDIQASLAAPVEGFVNSQRAAIALEQARDKFDRQHVADRNLWDAVVAYKEYLTYSGQENFELQSDASKYETALADLQRKIIAQYDEGTRALLQERWDAAIKCFQAIVSMVPDPTNRLNSSAMAHITYCKQRQQAKRPKRPF